MTAQAPSPRTAARLDKKVLVTTITAVTALHVLAGMALMNLPAMTSQPPTITPPLEISFVAAPKPSEPKQPIKKIAPANQAQAQPTAKSQPDVEKKISKKIQPPTQPKPARPVAEPTQPDQLSRPSQNSQPIIQPVAPVKPLKEAINQPIKAPATPVQTHKPAEATEAKPVVPQATPLEQTSILAQQAETAAKIAQQNALVNQVSQANQINQVEQAPPAKQQQQIAVAGPQAATQATAEQARAQTEHRAKETTQREPTAIQPAAKAQAATSQAKPAEQAAQTAEPVSFGNGDATWKTKPNLNLSGTLARIVTEENLSSIGVRLNVNSSGNITAVSIIRSSGNSQIDNAVRQRLQSAKLKPFTRNGIAVAGVGNLTINLH